MTVTRTTVRRHIDETGDSFRTFQEPTGEHIQALGLADQDGNMTGVDTLALSLAEIVQELRAVRFQLSLITDYDGGAP